MDYPLVVDGNELNMIGNLLHQASLPYTSLLTKLKMQAAQHEQAVAAATASVSQGNNTPAAPVASAEGAVTQGDTKDQGTSGS